MSKPIFELLIANSNNNSIRILPGNLENANRRGTKANEGPCKIDSLSPNDVWSNVVSPVTSKVDEINLALNSTVAFPAQAKF